MVINFVVKKLNVNHIRIVLLQLSTAAGLDIKPSQKSV